MQELLDIRDLNKSYKQTQVLHDLTFSVHPGEILCLLGPNGAGKSTIINILCGLLGYEEGAIIWKGQTLNRSLPAFKRRLGVVPQDLALYEDLSAEHNVRFFASLYGLRGKQLRERSAEALEFAGLLKRRSDKVSTFSGGMKRRLNIACALTHHPELLIMDEPTVGIDPQSRNHILQSIQRLKARGMTILYTTHYMEEVEEISERILVMDDGNIIAEGTSESLKEEIFDERQFEIDLEEPFTIRERDFYQIDGIRSLHRTDHTLTLTALKNIENLDQIIAVCMKQHLKIRNLTCRLPSLENVFLKLTGKSLRD